MFWEYDETWDDEFGRAGRDIKHAYHEWPDIDDIEILTADYMGDTADVTVKVRIRGFYSPGP